MTEPPADRAERAFVVAAGLALAAVLLVHVATAGSDVPVWDDFEAVPVLTGARPFSLAWLWEPGYGHRTPLRKVLILLLDGATGGHGIRATAFLNVLLLAAAAALCAGAARRLRGRTSYLDAAFPLLLLAPVWGPSALRATLVTGFLRTALLAAVLFLAAGARAGGAARALRGIAFCALGLALCLTPGLVAAVGIAGWVAWRTWRPAEEGERPGPRALLPARTAAAAVGVFAAFYLPGLSAGSPAADGRTLAGAGRVALQALGQGFGPAGAFGWEQSRWASFGIGLPPLFSLAALALVAVPGWALLRARGGATRLALEGPAAVSVAALAVAAATGWGRAGAAGDEGLQVHYGLGVAPALAAGLLLLPRALPGPRAEFLGTAAFALLCALLTFDLQYAHRMGRDRRERMAAVEADARAGISPADLARRHSPFLHAHPDELEAHLGSLRRAGRPPFGPR